MNKLGIKPAQVTRGTVLDEARNLITGNRADMHGDAKQNFTNIAKLWSIYLEREVGAKDVALMMALLKIARTKTGEMNHDDVVDAIGYLALGEEVSPHPLG